MIETAVIAQKALGVSNRKIADDLGINRQTVTRILEKNQFGQAVEYAQIRVHRMVPKACDAVEDAIDEGNATVAMRVLQGIGALKGESETTVNQNVQFVTTFETPKPTDPLQ